jgi:hypothetical protein
MLFLYMKQLVFRILHIKAIANDAARRDAAMFHLPRGRAVPPLSARNNIKGRIANVV